MFFPTIGLIATQDVISVDIHQPLQEALDRMHEKDHRSVVVLNGAIYHIVSTQDIIRFKLEGVDFSMPMTKLSLRILPRIGKESNILDALNLGSGNDEQICVCNEDGTLFGLVTNSDIIASVDPQVILDSLQISTIFENKYGYKTFDPQTPMEEILGYMKDARSDCVIIRKDELPVGIITFKDILRFIQKESISDLKAQQVMSSPVETLSAAASIREGLDYLRAKGYKRIVATDEDGRVMGIVTQQDLIARTYLRWSRLMQDHVKQFEEITQLLQQRNRHLAELATKDSLTDIHNRHMFAEMFDKESAMLRRYDYPLSLMMIDLDHFKQVNDTYGHNIGDAVLRGFASLVQSSIREADLFARWGGEEFVILLRNTNCREAFAAAEKIRVHLETHTFAEAGHVTCSIGITEIFAEDTLEDAVGRADKALYFAKQQGRNRTIACEANR